MATGNFWAAGRGRAIIGNMTADFDLPTQPSLLVHPGRPFIHRDLSWLHFNERVLSQARSTTNPLFERCKFLSVTASNLDEFFMIRFASLIKRGGGTTRAPISGAAAPPTRRVRDAILASVAVFNTRQAETFDMLVAALAELGIQLVRRTRPGEELFERGRRVFAERVLPALQPPHQFSTAGSVSLENLQLAALLPNEVWVTIPRSLPGLFPVQEGHEGKIRIFFLDHLLADHLPEALGVPEAPGLIRLTRDGDFTLELLGDDPNSVPDRVQSSVSQRELGRPVRLQYSAEVPPTRLRHLLEEFRLEPDQAFPSNGSLVLHGIMPILGDLQAPPGTESRCYYPPLQPFVPEPFRHTQRIFEQLQVADLLLHHPYDSFDAYVNFILAACEDPDVTAIEQTIYRTDGLATLFDALKAVAGRKKVRVIIEPRARFDELNNLRLTAELRHAGVEVGFGFGRLKLHAKIALVTRREAAGERLYTHLSTGNYNSRTARFYEDLAILTAHTDLGRDARHFFDSVWQQRVPGRFRQLISAPANLYRRMISLIDAETAAARAGKPARIFAKVNALVDEGMIEHLYLASQAGVRVDLVVRGPCSLIPGVAGLSENIRVIGLVDRHLEHSRIYAFQAANAVYLSSADWMPRNFFSRLEIAFPVLDPDLHRFLTTIVMPAYFADTVKARELMPDGQWKKRTQRAITDQPLAREGTRFERGPVRCQFFLEDLATKAYAGTPLQFRLQSHRPAAEPPPPPSP